MWFLIKAIFGFALVLLVLPFFGTAPDAQTSARHEIEMSATIEAAQSAIDDLTGICQRQPDVCKTGGEALAALGSQAREGALIAYRFLDDRFGGADGVVTGTVGNDARPAPSAAVPARTPDPVAALIDSAPVRSAEAAPVAATPANAIYPHPYSPPLD